MTQPMIKHLRPRNFLSFGTDFPGVDLGSLTILIGPNGCGKSNLIEAVAFMRAAPRDFQDVTRRGGGVSEWIGKTNPDAGAEVTIHASASVADLPDLGHVVAFTEENQAFHLADERIEETAKRDPQANDVHFHYRLQGGRPVVAAQESGQRRLATETLQPNLSILAQRRDPESYPELARLAAGYEKMRIYRDFTFGRASKIREPQPADMPEHPLAEDFSNLGLFLSNLLESPATKRAFTERLRDLFSGITDVHVRVRGGTVQVFLQEGDFAIPATRLSDGTLRYLCLLAILCDPEPPPLVCIEEPELGMHPDIIPKIADLLVEFSARSQLIVTTHSDILIDCMTETPEAVVVCEKHEGKTEMERLSRGDLAAWLEKYRLGQLWIDGEIGGKRW